MVNPRQIEIISYNASINYNWWYKQVYATIFGCKLNIQMLYYNQEGMYHGEKRQITGAFEV